jgi:hypothetical protein
MVIAAFGLGILVGMVSWLGLAAWLEAGRDGDGKRWTIDEYDRAGSRRKFRRTAGPCAKSAT